MFFFFFFLNVHTLEISILRRRWNSEADIKKHLSESTAESNLTRKFSDSLLAKVGVRRAMNIDEEIEESDEPIKIDSNYYEAIDEVTRRNDSFLLLSSSKLNYCLIFDSF
jgi:hypothetical protein